MAPKDPFFRRFLVAWQELERKKGGKRITGGDFAALLDVSGGSVTAWQEAEEPPPHERIKRIAAVCGVDPGWLAYGALTDASPPLATLPPIQKIKPRRVDSGEGEGGGRRHA